MRGINMGDLSAEPSMEDILSSIKRIIAEEGETAARGKRAPARPAARPAGEALAAPADVLELSQPIADPAPAKAAGAPAAEAIVSPAAAEASRGALEALSRMVMKPETPATETLEGLVREMLRPMLREWLDAQLPGIVEAMVAREIERISQQR